MLLLPQPSDAAHYNGYIDPSPSSFASPTESSPSASPQAFERRQHHSANFPLFLAQHTSAAPITVEPLDASSASGANPVTVTSWPNHTTLPSELRYSPPSRYSFVAGPPSLSSSPLSSSAARGAVTSMEYMYAYPAPHDAGHFGHGAPTTTRRRLSTMLATHPFHVSPLPVLHVYEQGAYGMMVSPDQESYHSSGLAHFTGGGPRTHFVPDQQPQPSSWPQDHQHHQQHQHHHAATGFSNVMMDARSMQPPLLLATPLPTSAPIVIDEPSLVQQSMYHHQPYDGPPSQTDLSAPGHSIEVSTTSTAPGLPNPITQQDVVPVVAYAYGPGPGPTGMDVDNDHRYGPEMDICTYETRTTTTTKGGPHNFTARAAPSSYAQPHHLVANDDGSDLNTKAPTGPHDQGRGDQSAGFVATTIPNLPLRAATLASSAEGAGRSGGVAPASSIVSAASTNSSDDGNENSQFGPMGNNHILANGDLQKEGVLESVAGVSDRSESSDLRTKANERLHRVADDAEAVDESGQHQHQHSLQYEPLSNTNLPSRETSVQIKMSPNSSAPALFATFDSDANSHSQTSHPGSGANDMLDSVAVAPLPQSTALEFTSSGERFGRTQVDRRVNGEGAADVVAYSRSPSELVAVNGTGTSIKSPKIEDEDHTSSQTTLEGVAATSATSLPPSTNITTTSPSQQQQHSTLITGAVDIDRSHSLSLQIPTNPPTTPTTDTVDPSQQQHQQQNNNTAAEMQVISSHSRGQDSHGYNVPSIYPFTPLGSSTYNKPSSYNTHAPSVSSLLRPEWRRNSASEYSTISHQQQGSDGSVSSDRRHSFDYEDGSHVVPLHRGSLPIAPTADHRSPQDMGGSNASAHHSPSPAPGYYTPGERLVPAAFGNASSSHGSGSSASSTPPTISHDASLNPPAPVYSFDPSSSHHPALYDSPREQKIHYEPAYPAVFNAAGGANTTPGTTTPSYRGTNGMYYGSYPTQGYAPTGTGAPGMTGAPTSHYGHTHRGSSSSPAPPMIAGTKRGREDEWVDEAEVGRELQRRRSSYSQSTAMMMGGLAYRAAASSTAGTASPSIQSAEMGVIRVAGYVPSLKDMGVRDLTGEPQPLHLGIERYANGRRPGEDAIRSGSDTSYSFISLPGNTVRKRPRRKFEEITRNYVCIWPGCSKAYGTLNHLNAHVTMQKHGAKRVPSEFKELRKVWRKQKREQQQQQQQHQQLPHHLGHAHGMQNETEYYHDDDREEDDEGSIYNPAVDSTQ